MRTCFTVPSQKSTAEILARVERGERLSADDCLRLVKEGDLLSLGRAADRVRERLHPDRVVTYIVDRNINYTNVCVAYCKFCAFYRPPRHAEGYVLSRDVLREKLRELQEAGGVTVLLQGGHHPSLPLEWYEDLLRWIKSEFGFHLHAFSAPEIDFFSRLYRIPVEQVLRRLQAAGMDTLPGGGAEILSDRVRRALARNRCSADDWIAVHRAAHRIGMRSTATMVIGHLETPEEQVEHLQRLRDLQDETGGFTAFILWTMQTENTEIRDVRPIGGHSYLRMQAIARLFLDNIPNLQSSWVTQGPEIGQLALRFGANDMGGTMMEENVVSQAGATYRMSEEKIRRAIRACGFTPRRRTTLYQLLPDPEDVPAMPQGPPGPEPRRK